MLRADREVERIAGTQAGLVLVDESRSSMKLIARYRQHDQIFLDQHGECSEAFGAVFGVQLARAQFQRHCAGKFGEGPFADLQRSGRLRGQPVLGGRCPRFIAQGCDDDTGVEVEIQ